MNRTATDKTCRILIEGAELVELKRHAHQIPECPGLDRRIQRYDGNKPLVISPEELDWLVAVLDAVLLDPKGCRETKVTAKRIGRLTARKGARIGVSDARDRFDNRTRPTGFAEEARKRGSGAVLSY